MLVVVVSLPVCVVVAQVGDSTWVSTVCATCGVHKLQHCCHRASRGIKKGKGDDTVNSLNMLI